MLTWIFLFVFFLNPIQDVNAQDTEPITTWHQIGIRHDNDFIVLTDRYYSFGLYINYIHKLADGIFPNTSEQIHFNLGVQAFTPDDTKTRDISQMDRPYAGYLGLNNGWSVATPNSFYDLQLELGIAGKSAGAGALQRWYHNAVVISDPQSWVGELSNSFHFNFYARYAREWQLAPNPFSVHIALQPWVAYGTKDQFIQAEVAAYFGRRNSLNSSIAYDQLGSTEREIFFALRFGYRFVGYNGLLEGNLWGDDSVYLVEPNAVVLHLGFDFKHRYKKNDYSVGYRFNSDETEHTQTHQYIILSYARSF